MTVLEAVILGLVQGLAEFLPISSSGHLIIVQNLLGLKNNMLSFDVLLHVGTLIPVFIVFWQEIFALIKRPFQKMTLLLIVGTLPAVIFTLLLGDIIDSLFAGGLFLAIGYVITGILLLVSDRLKLGKKTEKDMSIADALAIGTVQAIAITPGISRSGSTITGSLFMGLTKDAAASYSFLLSIPAILGATVLQLKDIVTGESSLVLIDFAPALAGFLTAAVSGYIAIRFMLNLIKKRKLKFFAVYVFILAAVLVVDYFTLGMII
ncbi:MAG: undecaprenyl-diphosphate phosphatase [Clostridiales bacterium]|nr:undecaprenyl-diphosphate phosphatase [Clostridiales bacterium]